MFDLIDEDVFEGAVKSHFNLLDEHYVEDVCDDLLKELRTTFNFGYETRFLIVDSETGKPMNVNAVLKTREAAVEFLKIVGDDKYMVALLLTEK